MIEKAKSESDEKQKAEKQKHDEADDELGRELEDSFPASDPPSMTQPSGKTGAPDHRATKRITSGRRRIRPALAWLEDI